MNTKPPRELESKVQRSIKVRLARLGIVLFRRNVGGLKDAYGHYVPFASPGQSDLYGSLPRSHHCRHVELETKRLGERPTPKQLEWLKASTARGWVAFWADNANTAEFVAESILAGGEIVWLGVGPGYHPDGADFDVRMP